MKLHGAKNMGLGGRENYLGLTHGGGLSGGSWATGAEEPPHPEGGILKGEATGQVSEPRLSGGSHLTPGGPQAPSGLWQRAGGAEEAAGPVTQGEHPGKSCGEMCVSRGAGPPQSGHCWGSHTLGATQVKLLVL